MNTTPLFVYNTLSRKRELFTPLDPRHVRAYVCGPTVYHRIHLGNSRSAVVFDVVHRVLKHLYPRVTYVSNLTDVDDKINQRAHALGLSIRELTQQTIRDFHQDVSALGILPPDVEARATDHIGEMIALIDVLIEKKHAYVHAGHVLFDVKSFPSYGSLSRMPLDQIQQGARVEVAPYKKNPEDFVLWKPSTEAHEPRWPSPWGEGRPGWHIECSAMARKYLGPMFDIHGGGEDLTFPHHENEIAQSCAASGESDFARYWLHNGMLIVGGQKMSKSLGNFVLLCDVLDAHPGEIVRWALLSAHYRQMLDWTEALLEQARACVDTLYQALLPWEKTASPEERVSSDVLSALCEDFNTPGALGALQHLAKVLNKTTNPQQAQMLAGELRASAHLLGFLGQTPTAWFQRLKPAAALSPVRIEALLAQRNTARKEHNFALADSIREELESQGITLEDKADGTTFWKIR